MFTKIFGDFALYNICKANNDVRKMNMKVNENTSNLFSSSHLDNNHYEIYAKLKGSIKFNHTVLDYLYFHFFNQLYNKL
jgi:hypothetical protein